MRSSLRLEVGGVATGVDVTIWGTQEETEAEDPIVADRSWGLLYVRRDPPKLLPNLSIKKINNLYLELLMETIFIINNSYFFINSSYL